MSMPKFSGKLMRASLSPLMTRSIPRSKAGGIFFTNAPGNFTPFSALNILQTSKAAPSCDLAMSLNSLAMEIFANGFRHKKTRNMGEGFEQIRVMSVLSPDSPE